MPDPNRGKTAIVTDVHTDGTVGEVLLEALGKPTKRMLRNRSEIKIGSFVVKMADAAAHPVLPDRPCHTAAESSGSEPSARRAGMWRGFPTRRPFLDRDEWETEVLSESAALYFKWRRHPAVGCACGVSPRVP